MTFSKNLSLSPKRSHGKFVIHLIPSGVLIIAFALSGILIAQPSCSRCAPTDRKLSSERLKKHVAVLSEELVPRSYQNVGNLDQCASYIEGHFEQAGGRVTVQEYEVDGEIYKNVIAAFGPQTTSRIVVGAHYDAYREFPGADDNASGVAGLIELGHLLKGVELGQRIELVAFTLEEPPFFRTDNMGSARYAKELHSTNADIEAMICLEMIGFFSDEKSSQRYPSAMLQLFYPDRANYIAVVGSTGDRKLIKQVKDSMKGATDLPVCSMSAPKVIPGIDFSDHLNFWNQGYTAVMVTDTAFYRNLEYHTVNDTLCRLDFDRMAKVTLGVYEAVMKMANEDSAKAR